MNPVRFSIFLPVRNGFPYIKDCIQSILNQSYPHFELNILDNLSTDETVSWIASLKDPRIHLFTSSKPLSMEDSWARILDIPKQKYITLIGHDDLFEPHFLEVIENLITKYPNASLYQTGALFINPKGKKIRNCITVPKKESAADYLTARFISRRDVYGTGYVMRSKDYDEVKGIPNFEKLLFADDALWLMLTDKSWKASDPRLSASIRIHPGSESASMPGGWSSTLKGIEQFMEFLNNFKSTDVNLVQVVRNFSPRFLLRYYQNIYIFALMEASENGELINPEIFGRIQRSLAVRAPGMGEYLRDSSKVKVVEYLNQSSFRRYVKSLYRTYYTLRTSSLTSFFYQ